MKPILQIREGLAKPAKANKCQVLVDTWMSRVGLCLFGFRTLGFALLSVRIVTDSPFLLKGNAKYMDGCGG